MKPNNKNALQQLLNDKKAIEQVAKSPDAQALAGMISQSNDEASLKKIAADAARGDTSQLNDLIQSIVKSPSGARLLQRLSETMEKK